jgi:transposase-like protein
MVPNHHGGLVNAVHLHYQGAAWRRMRAIFEAPDAETVRLLLAAFCAEFEHSAPLTVATLERSFDDATAILSLAEPHSRLRTTNTVEPPNEDTRRREPVIRISQPANRRSASSARCSWSRMWPG